MNTSISVAVFVRILLHHLQPTVVVVLDPSLVGLHPLCAQIVDVIYQNANTLAGHSYVQVLGLSNYFNRQETDWVWNGSPDKQRSARLQLRHTILTGDLCRVLCIHVLTSKGALFEEPPFDALSSTQSLLGGHFGHPVHRYQHVLLIDPWSANEMAEILGRVQLQLPLAYVTRFEPVENRVESVVRAIDKSEQWLGVEFEAVLQKNSHIWR